MSIMIGKSAMQRPRVFVSILVAATGVLFAMDIADAAAPSLTAVLSNSDAAVGETVQLEIHIRDAGNGIVPPEISVEGLEIHQTGTSRQFEMHNFNTSTSITYNYTVLPLKGGTFKIPPQTIQAGGSSLRTPELTLHVAASAGRQTVPGTAGRGNPGSENLDPSKLVTAELIIPKKSAFVGEMIPAVVRIASAVHVLGLEAPEVVGQGFTMQKLQGADQPQVETAGGRQWEVYTFKTAIAAVRPGKFEIGPAKTKAKVVMPAARSRSRSRSPFDIFNNDPFSDPFFSDPFGRLGEKRDVEITGEPVALEIKPLPPNPPASFGGAVGNFTMNVEANPKSVQVGDPITVKTAIAGRGNFDRIAAPPLEDERGWHKYPANSKFEKDDDVGISGTKTFETVLSPNENKPAVPPLLFTYFDPVKEHYVNLRSDPVPIRVEGGATAAATSPQAASAAAAPTPPAASGKASPPPTDILYQLSERPAQAQSFTPLFRRRNFWIAQILPFLALIGLIGWKVRHTRSQNREAKRVAALQHEMTDLMRKLRRGDFSPQEYFPQASRLIQVKTALARNVDPGAVDMETAAGAFRLDASEREQLRELFQRSDELRYSGAHNGGNVVSPEMRRDVLHLIENLRP